MKKFFRILLWVIVAAVFIGTFVYLYMNSRTKETVYEIVSPSNGDIERTTVLTGKIEPRDEIEIKPQVSGIISEINVEAGDQVNEGDVIARIKIIPDEVYSNAMASNHSILAARQGIVVADKAIDVARSGYLPRLNFSAGLGSSYYTVNGFDNAGFSRQMRDNFSKSLGFSLSVPIFDAFSTRNQIRRAKVQRVNAELELEQRQSTLYKDIRQAYCQAVAAERKFSASTVATEATRAALDAVTEKFNYGKANATEFEQAKSEYVKSRAEMVQAKYEMILRNRILAFYNLQ